MRWENRPRIGKERDMKRTLAVALITGILGFVAGNAFWYLASPLWIDRVVSEGLPAELQMHIAAQGDFRDADASHKGKGMAKVFATDAGSKVLRFTGFEATNGPDLKVWLVKAPNILSSADVKASEWLSLGPLKGNIGDQNYVRRRTSCPRAEFQENRHSIWLR
jgi:hypothetical protein